MNSVNNFTFKLYEQNVSLFGLQMQLVLRNNIHKCEDISPLKFKPSCDYRGLTKF